MKGDFSRDSFDPIKHYTRVLMQQGRVQLDADWNEQIAILLYRMECLVTDLIGSGGGPNRSFEIVPIESTRDFTVLKGRFYVGGIMVESDSDFSYSSVAKESGEITSLKPDQPYLVFLDAWEELVTNLQDPGIADVALGGLDTTARTRIAWRVRVQPVPQVVPCTSIQGEPVWKDVMDRVNPSNNGLLVVRARELATSHERSPCITPPQARYRGAENQLYRVEIHDGGKADDASGATFKWSRENGSVAVAVLEGSGDTLKVASLGRDRAGFQPGDWVEVTDDAHPHQPLFRVTVVDPAGRRVTVDTKTQPQLIDIQPDLHPVLRRWDQKPGAENVGGLRLRGGAAVIREGSAERNWLALEDGVEIQFQPARTGTQQYRSGDYWIFPARTANDGEVIWTLDGQQKPLPQAPMGVKHRYAPLGIISFLSKGGVDERPCRQVLPLTPL